MVRPYHRSRRLSREEGWANSVIAVHYGLGRPITEVAMLPTGTTLFLKVGDPYDWCPSTNPSGPRAVTNPNMATGHHGNRDHIWRLLPAI